MLQPYFCSRSGADVRSARRDAALGHAAIAIRRSNSIAGFETSVDMCGGRMFRFPYTRLSSE